MSGWSKTVRTAGFVRHPRVVATAQSQPFGRSSPQTFSARCMFICPEPLQIVLVSSRCRAMARGPVLFVTADIQNPAPDAPPPSLDSVLGWLADLEKNPQGSSLLSRGGALLNQAVSDFGEAHVEAVANRLIDLRDEGFVTFTDPLARIDQLPSADRLGKAFDFRLRSAGHDRLEVKAPTEASVVQIINATTAQVAAGNIINEFKSFDELLDALAAKIDGVEGVDDEAKQEAHAILGKLRSAGGTVATSALGSAGGALLGSVLKQFTGLP